MKIKRKIMIAIITALTILLTNSMLLINSVQAANLIEISQVDLHSGGNCGQLLKYKGVIVKCYYVEYTYKGKSYPAYCLDKTLTGVSDDLAYAVNPSNTINDIGLWRTVINGYPYKSLSELGVVDKEEAFTATKQAIYCYLFENTPEDYEALNDGGERTLSALKKIVKDASESKEVPGASETKIEAESEEWEEDELDSNYISKVYSFNSINKHKGYKIAVEGDVPEGTKITNLDGEETTEFSNDDKFKIMLLKDNLDEDGTFTLDIQTEVKTKPVIYGSVSNPDWQNYALTGYAYEDSATTYEDSYNKIEKPKIPEKPKVPEEPTVPENPVEEVKILPVTGM